MTSGYFLLSVLLKRLIFTMDVTVNIGVCVYFSGLTGPTENCLLSGRITDSGIDS